MRPRGLPQRRLTHFAGIHIVTVPIALESFTPEREIETDSPSVYLLA